MSDSALDDVYSGDTATPLDDDPSRGAVFRYHIEAEAQPDVLARVANVFNIANRSPRSASLMHHKSDQVVMQFEIGPLDEARAQFICRKLLQLTCVIEARVVATSGARREA